MHAPEVDAAVIYQALQIIILTKQHTFSQSSAGSSCCCFFFIIYCLEVDAPVIYQAAV
jgi:hypothetical protein